MKSTYDHKVMSQLVIADLTFSRVLPTVDIEVPEARSSDLMRGFVRIRFFPTLSRRCTETIDTSALESIIHVVGLALSITSVVAEMPFL